jgi:hypothetical protein
MPFTNITKPTQGDATKKSLADVIIDDLNDLNTRLLAVGTIQGLKNASFETDSDSDGIPDSWTRTLYTGGSFTLDSTDQNHAAKAAKFTSPGGASNGGGYLDTTDFFEVSPLLWYRVEWLMKSSAAGVNNRVEMTFYDSAQASISTESLYNSSSNPTSWTPFSRRVRPPATARYAKLRLTGCHTSSTTAGSTWFDNVVIIARQFDESVEFTATGAWKAVYTGLVRITCIGGGGGGGSSSGSGGGGGGSARSVVSVTAGTVYTITVGTGGTANNGGNNTTANGVQGNGGGPGASGGGAGGTGGTGTGQETWTGDAGESGGPGSLLGGYARLDNGYPLYGKGGDTNTTGGNGWVKIEF